MAIKLELGGQTKLWLVNYSALAQSPQWRQTHLHDTFYTTCVKNLEKLLHIKNLLYRGWQRRILDASRKLSETFYMMSHSHDHAHVYGKKVTLTHNNIYLKQNFEKALCLCDLCFISIIYFTQPLKKNPCQLGRQRVLFYTLITEMHVEHNGELNSCPWEVLGTAWVLIVNLISFTIYITAWNTIKEPLKMLLTGSVLFENVGKLFSNT